MPRPVTLHRLGLGTSVQPAGRLGARIPCGTPPADGMRAQGAEDPACHSRQPRTLSTMPRWWNSPERMYVVDLKTIEANIVVVSAAGPGRGPCETEDQ